MEMEPPAQKVRLVIGTMFHFLAAGAIGGLFLAWMVNVNNIQAEYETLCANGELAQCSNSDTILYDVLFDYGPFTDTDQANSLRLTIMDDCNEECQQLGCRWSIIYTLSGFTMVLYAAFDLIMCIGTW